MTEIAIYQASVRDRMQYAEALSGSSLLPRDYVGKPANVLLAIEYGAALGIPPMTAIQGVHVINGKPTASAGLIGALVRKAGHRLRVTGDDKHAVCEIVRADDPEFTFRSEWTWDRAVSAKLTGKDTWKAYPAAMLKARAITECARDACPEALAGVAYTAEELGDDTPHVEPVGHVEPAPTWDYAEVVDAVIVDETPAGGAVGEDPPPAGPRSTRDPDDRRPFLNDADGPATKAQTGMMFALLKGDDGKARPRDESLAIIAGIIGREVASSSELTKAETSAVIDALKAAQA